MPTSDENEIVIGGAHRRQRKGMLQCSPRVFQRDNGELGKVNGGEKSAFLSKAIQKSSIVQYGDE